MYGVLYNVYCISEQQVTCPLLEKKCTNELANIIMDLEAHRANVAVLTVVMETSTSSPRVSNISK